jgi:crossover junction endodeoxyribonuclease RusA
MSNDMRPVLNLRLPYPPSANAIWEVVRNRIKLTERGRLYRREVAMCVLNQVGTPEAIGGPVSVTVEASPPDGRKRDLDNLCKATLDALTHAKVWGDDSQVRRLWLEMGEQSRGGFLKITIQPYEPLKPST